MPNSGKPEFGCHPRLCSEEGVDARHKAGHDDAEVTRQKIAAGGGRTSPSPVAAFSRRIAGLGVRAVGMLYGGREQTAVLAVRVVR